MVARVSCVIVMTMKPCFSYFRVGSILAQAPWTCTRLVTGSSNLGNDGVLIFLTLTISLFKDAVFYGVFSRFREPVHV